MSVSHLQNRINTNNNEITRLQNEIRQYEALRTRIRTALPVSGNPPIINSRNAFRDASNLIDRFYLTNNRPGDGGETRALHGRMDGIVNLLQNQVLPEIERQINLRRTRITTLENENRSLQQQIQSILAAQWSNNW